VGRGRSENIGGLELCLLIKAIYDNTQDLFQTKPLKSQGSAVVYSLEGIWIRCRFEQESVICADLQKGKQFPLFLSRKFVGIQFWIQNLRKVLKGSGTFLKTKLFDGIDLRWGLNFRDIQFLGVGVGDAHWASFPMQKLRISQ
jgi:hypothetical protein